MKKVNKLVIMKIIIFSIVLWQGSMLGSSIKEVYADSESIESEDALCSEENNIESPEIKKYKGYIKLEDRGGKYGSTYIYAGSKCSDHCKEGKVEGMKYSEKTNTLIINGFKGPKCFLDIKEMGSDFKIKIKGNKNSLMYINSKNSVFFKGSGKLVVNKKRGAYGAIYIKSRVIFSKKVRITSYIRRTDDGIRLGDTLRVSRSRATLSDMKKSVICKGGKMSRIMLNIMIGHPEENCFYCPKMKFVKR